MKDSVIISYDNSNSPKMIFISDDYLNPKSSDKSNSKSKLCPQIKITFFISYSNWEDVNKVYKILIHFNRIKSNSDLDNIYLFQSKNNLNVYI